MCISDLQIFVPPLFCIRDKQSLPLCSVCLLQTVLSWENFICHQFCKFWLKLQLHFKNADNNFVQWTCTKHLLVRKETTISVLLSFTSTPSKYLPASLLTRELIIPPADQICGQKEQNPGQVANYSQAQTNDFPVADPALQLSLCPSSVIHSTHHFSELFEKYTNKLANKIFVQFLYKKIVIYKWKVTSGAYFVFHSAILFTW